MHETHPLDKHFFRPKKEGAKPRGKKLALYRWFLKNNGFENFQKLGRIAILPKRWIPPSNNRDFREGPNEGVSKAF